MLYTLLVFLSLAIGVPQAYGQQAANAQVCRRSALVPPTISVVVPVYQGAEFVSDALHSLFNQTIIDRIEIIVSVDKCKDKCDNSSGLVLGMKKDNMKVFIQEKNLGWVKNCNFLIRQASGTYVSILPDDDTIPPNYFEVLLQEITRNPSAVNVFPKLQHGNKANIVTQSQLEGPLQTRLMKVARESYHAVSFRGLVKRSTNPYQILLREDQHLDLFTDSLQIFQHATLGELVQGDVIYYKRRRANSAHNKWQLVPDAEAAKAWALHCATLFNEGAIYRTLHMKDFNHSMHVRLLRSFGKLLPGKNLSLYFPSMLQQYHTMVMKKRVAILGGGIQGCTMALLFAKYGYDVTIFDKAADIMTKASMNQEGKIHMGFVFSADKSLKTGEKMMRSAMAFSSVLEYLVEEKIDWETLKSTKFNYLVPKDSLVSPDELEVFFGKLQDLYTKILEDEPTISYLGARPKKIFRRLPSVPDNLNQSYFAAVFESEEYALSQLGVKSYLQRALQKKNVRILTNNLITSVKRLEKSSDDESHQAVFEVISDQNVYQFDEVVNCLWEGQRDIDKSFGGKAAKKRDGDNYRLKFGIKTEYIKELADMPSATIVNGAYGDFVRYPNDDRMYFSWYPVSLYGMVHDNEIPNEWREISAGIISPELRKYQIEQQKFNFQQLFLSKNGSKPSFDMECPELIGGFIVASGSKSIDHYDSGLHKRSFAPFFHDDGYYSISTQKFTYGPYHAMLFERMFLNRTAGVDKDIPVGITLSRHYSKYDEKIA